jgi:hypothetical protein
MTQYDDYPGDNSQQAEEGRDDGHPPPGRSDEPAENDEATTRSRSPRKRRRKRKGHREAATAKSTRAPTRSRVLILGGLGMLAAAGAAALFLFLRPRSSRDWRIGDDVDVEITLVAADKRNLACAATADVGGKHCAFETPTTPRAGDAEDRMTLRPYTTTDRRQILAAGLWSDAGLTGALPSSRFSVRCTFTVESVVQKPAVRWSAAGSFQEADADWHAGTVKACALVQPATAASTSSVTPAKPR